MDLRTRYAIAKDKSWDIVDSVRQLSRIEQLGEIHAFLRTVLGKTPAGVNLEAQAATSYYLGLQFELQPIAFSALVTATSFMFQGCLLSCDSYEPVHSSSLIVSQWHHTAI